MSNTPTVDELEKQRQQILADLDALEKDPKSKVDPNEDDPSKELPEIKMEEVITVDPAELSDRQKAYLEEHKADLSPEQREKYGIKMEEAPTETDEEKKAREEAEAKAKADKEAEEKLKQEAQKKKEDVEKGEKKDKPDYEEKFKNSSRQAQLESYKNKALNNAFEEASKITDVPEAELRTAYPQWDDMDDIQKQLAKDNVINKKKLVIIQDAKNKFREVDDWNEKVDKFVADPAILAKNPEIEGKEEDFKAYANHPDRRNLPFDVLLPAFLHDVEKLEKPKHKGKMFESGESKSDIKVVKKSGKFTFEQGQAIMKNNYNKYKELLGKGMIEGPVL